MLLALLLSAGLSAQLTPKAKGTTPEVVFKTVTEKTAATLAVTKELGNFGSLRTDEETHSALIGAAPEKWSLTIPANAVAPKGLTLTLRRNRITRPGTRLRRASDGATIPRASLGLHYVGEIAGQPGSRAAFSVLDNEMVGSISEAGGRQLTIGRIRNYVKTKGEDDTYVIFPAEQIAGQTPLNCATEDDGYAYAPEELATDVQDKSGAGCVNIYLEVDHNIVVDKGSVEAAGQYVAAIFNQVHALYDDIAVDIFISEMLAWDGASPYGGTTSIDYLFGFQRYRRSFNGDIAHLVSYGASGGVAILNGLCSRRLASRMSFSSIHTTFSTVPTYSWSVMVMAHEIGHQLGANHTHACVWNGNGTAIDGCAGGTEGTCPNPGYPATGGTIMSYCHLRANVGINFTSGFGPQPGAVIVNRVTNAQNCLNNDCATGGDGNTGGNGGDDNGERGIDCAGGRTVNFSLTVDNFGTETTWRIISDTGGEVMVAGGPYKKKKGGTAYNSTFCLPDGCYTLQVFDSDGDGMCCDYGNGTFELSSITDGVVLSSGNGIFTDRFNDDFCVDASGGDDDKDDGNPTDCPAFDFTYYAPETYGTNQDEGTFSVRDSGQTIYLENNAWKAIRFPYQVTEETWLSFWFKSTEQGEIHGIGLDNNLIISAGYTFRLHGTQPWGIGRFATYPDDGEWHYYEIPVGQYYTGAAEWLFFTADKDIGSFTSNSYFRSVTLTEGDPCNTITSLSVTIEEAAKPITGAVRVTPNPADGEVTVAVPGLDREAGFTVFGYQRAARAAGSYRRGRPTDQYGEPTHRDVHLPIGWPAGRLRQKIYYKSLSTCRQAAAISTADCSVMQLKWPFGHSAWPILEQGRQGRSGTSRRLCRSRASRPGR